MTTIMLETNKKTLDFQSPNNLGDGFNKSVDNLNLSNSKIQTAYKKSIIAPNAFANFQAEPTRLAFSPLKKISPIKTTASSNNMLMPNQFRTPYRVGERIGKYKGNDVIFKTDKTAQINGKIYNLPQAAIDLNEKGNGIGILRSVNYWITHPEAIAKAYVGVINKPSKTKAKPATPSSANLIKKIMAGAIRAGTIGLALKGEVNVPGLGRGKYTISFYVNNKDLEAMANGMINFGDLIQKGGFSFTFNKVISSVNMGGIPTERADTNSISFNPINGFSKTFGKKDTLKTGNITLELGAGGRASLDGKIGLGAAPKLSFKIPGTQTLINKGLQAAIDWAGKSALVNTVISPPLAAVQVSLAAALAAIQATKPYVAIEAALPIGAYIDVRTGEVSLSAPNKTFVKGTLPQLTNSMLDFVGLGKYQLQGGKAKIDPSISH